MSTTAMPPSKVKTEKTLINPWKWQDNLGFSQAIEIASPRSTLYVSGQAAINPNGVPSPGDMAEQITSSLDNLETVLTEAGYSLTDIVRLNYYTTSVQEFFAAYDTVLTKLATVGCKPASTLIEVKALAFPQLKVEIEATAVKH